MTHALTKSLSALTAALLLGSGAAIAQTLENHPGFSSEISHPLMMGDEPQYQATHQYRGTTIGEDMGAIGPVPYSGPEYQKAHDNKGVTIGPSYPHYPYE